MRDATLGSAPNNTSKDWVILIRLATGDPVADAGPDQTVLDADDSGSESIALDGSGSYDPGGAIADFSWQEAGTQIATGESPTVDLGVGEHTITLIVTDDEGNTDSDTVVITINAYANQAPQVDAGVDQAITLPDDTVNLDGTVTDDGLPEGAALTTAWSKVSGPGTVTFGDGSAVDTTAAFSAAGSYVLRLTADDTELSAADDVSVTVEEEPAPPPPGDVVFATNCGGGEVLAVDGTLYAADTDYSGGRTYTTGDPIADTEDDALYRSERYGNFSYSVPVLNGDYVVTLHLAEIYWTGTQKRIFDVLIEDLEVVTDLDLYATVGHDAAYDVDIPVTVADGVLEIVFRTDVNNAKASAIRVATADGTPNEPPVADAYADPASGDTTTSFTLHGSGSYDPDGTIVSYAWDFGDGNTATGMDVSHTYAEAGTYTATLTVTDDDGATDADSVSITVDTPPDTEAPTVPQDLTATAVSTSRIDLAWSASTDNVGVTGYQVLRDGTLIDAVADTAYADTGLAAGTTYAYTVKAVDAAGNVSAGATAEATTESEAGGDVVAAINCGGASYTAIDGTVYAADANYAGGRTYSKSDPISNTEDDALYRTERYGDFTYSLPVANADYTVTLHLAEIYWTAAGKRVFDVTIEGAEVVTDLDLYATAGHDAAHDITVQVSVTDGTLDIVYHTDVNNAKASAILVKTAGTPPPPENQAPTVDAGADQTITLPDDTVSLDGTVSDDGLPGTGLITAWSKVAGPGTVTFGNAAAVDTSATFGAAGTYTLRLAADDGELSASDDVSVVVEEAPPPPSTGSVDSFTLIDANTDQAVATLQDGGTMNLEALASEQLNIRANVSGTVESVRFALDGNANFQTENHAPYALVGDTNGDYKAWTPTEGTHTLTATPYPQDNASGTAGTARTITFEVVRSSLGITGFTLVDAASDQDLRALPDGGVIDRSADGTALNIRAEVMGTLQSVRFFLDGQVFGTENVPPYALAGDTSGDYNGWNPPVGTHVLEAVPYADDNAGGTAGPGLTITFEVVE